MIVVPEEECVVFFLQLCRQRARRRRITGRVEQVPKKSEQRVQVRLSAK